MNIRIYTNVPKTEYAICCEGDQVMRAVTATGIQYTELEGQYVITAMSDLAFIDEKIQEALELHIDYIDNCNESDKFECCNCLGTIEAHEAHSEIVLYAGDDKIGMIAAMHNDCSEAEQSA